RGPKPRPTGGDGGQPSLAGSARRSVVQPPEPHRPGSIVPLAGPKRPRGAHDARAWAGQLPPCLGRPRELSEHERSGQALLRGPLPGRRQSLSPLPRRAGPRGPHLRRAPLSYAAQWRPGLQRPGRVSYRVGGGALMEVLHLGVDDLEWREVLGRLRHDFYHLPEYVSLDGEWNHARPMAFLARSGDAELFIPYLLCLCDDLFSAGVVTDPV